MKFNGLCVLRDLKRGFHKEDNIKVRNYILDLEILNIDHINLDWLHLRRIDFNESLKVQPEVWREYIKSLI